MCIYAISKGRIPLYLVSKSDLKEKKQQFWLYFKTFRLVLINSKTGCMLEQNANVITRETTRKTSVVSLANHIQVHCRVNRFYQFALPVGIRCITTVSVSNAAQIRGMWFWMADKLATESSKNDFSDYRLDLRVSTANESTEEEQENQNLWPRWDF